MTTQLQFDKLELIPRTRHGGGGRTQREYLDFIVNGQSLADLIRAGDFIGCLGWGNSDWEKTNILQLLRKEQPVTYSGRVPILVCAECGDLGCGAVTVRIERTPSGIQWSDFAFENDYDEEGVKSYPHVGLYLFDTTAYWQVLTQRLSAR
jgi:hypothetical protein